MADFCNQCADGLDLPRGDLAGIVSAKEFREGKFGEALCEGCGKLVQVDHQGTRVDLLKPDMPPMPFPAVEDLNVEGWPYMRPPADIADDMLKRAVEAVNEITNSTFGSANAEWKRALAPLIVSHMTAQVAVMAIQHEVPMAAHVMDPGSIG